MYIYIYRYMIHTYIYGAGLLACTTVAGLVMGT
jgi:hypothetical protein